MKTGYQKLNNNRYYFDPETGKAMPEFITVTFSDGDFLFYFAGEKGTLSACKKLMGGTYYLSSMGEVQTGFQIINGGKYYFDEKTGKAQYGLIKANNGYTYYFQEDGKYLTGLQVLEDDAYYFSSGGVMMTGYRK